MKSKITTLVVIAVTVIAVVFTWYFLKYIIEEYNVDENVIQVDREQLVVTSTHIIN